MAGYGGVGVLILTIGGAGGGGAGGGELGDLGDDAELGGAGGGAVLDGGGESCQYGGGALEAFDVGYVVGAVDIVDVLEEEPEERGFADVGDVVELCPVGGAGVLDGEDVFGVVDVVGGGGEGVGGDGFEGGFEFGGGGELGAGGGGVLEVEVVFYGADEADGLAEGEG